MAGNRTTGAGAHNGVEKVGTFVGADGFVTGDAGGETGSAELYRPLKIAAIYVRVSTERQEKEQTVDSQLDALYRAAREGDYEVAPSHVFIDERRSGAAALTSIALGWTV